MKNKRRSFRANKEFIGDTEKEIEKQEEVSKVQRGGRSSEGELETKQSEKEKYNTESLGEEESFRKANREGER